MGGYSLFVGSALLGYAGSGIGYLAHKGYKKHQEDKAAKVWREVQRKLEPAGGHGRGGTSSEAGATLAAAGLVLLFLGALAR